MRTGMSCPAVSRSRSVSKAAGRNARSRLRKLLFPQIQLVDEMLVIIEHLFAPNLHGGRHLTGLDGELAFEYAKAPDLLEGRELLVDALHRAIDFIGHGRGF